MGPPQNPVVSESRPILLNQRYRIVKLLGAGVYGKVYLAKDTLNGDKLVAIKRQIIADKAMAEQVKKDGYLKTGIREMSLLQELGSGPKKHPNIVELIECFQLKDKTPCIVIEYMEKGSLTNLLAADTESGGQ